MENAQENASTGQDQVQNIPSSSVVTEGKKIQYSIDFLLEVSQSPFCATALDDLKIKKITAELNFKDKKPKSARSIQSRAPVPSRQRKRPENTQSEDRPKNEHEFADKIGTEVAPKHFDMEKFKEEMRRQDQPSGSSAASTASSIEEGILSTPKAEPEPILLPSSISSTSASSRQKSRFGGRFFRLDDDDEDGNNNSEVVSESYSSSGKTTPEQDRKANSSMDLSALVTNSIKSTLKPDEALKGMPSESRKSSDIKMSETRKPFAFSAGVPTSVIRKMSEVNIHVQLQPDVSKDLSTPKTTLSPLSKANTDAHENPVTSSSFVPFPQSTAVPSIPYHPQANFFAQFQSTQMPLNAIPPPMQQSRVSMSPADTMFNQRMMEPVVHIGPDGQKIELPPPHIFVQMLMANSMPVPPELLPLAQMIPAASQLIPMQPQQPFTFDMMRPQQTLMHQHSIPPVNSTQLTEQERKPDMLSQLFASAGSPSSSNHNHPPAAIAGRLDGRVYSLEDIENHQK